MTSLIPGPTPPSRYHTTIEPEEWPEFEGPAPAPHAPGTRQGAWVWFLAGELFAATYCWLDGDEAGQGSAKEEARETLMRFAHERIASLRDAK